jgi:hypothetical protein
VARWFRSSLSVPGPFVCRCLTSSTLLPFPLPARRTGRADLPHPALGQARTPHRVGLAVGRGTPPGVPEPSFGGDRLIATLLALVPLPAPCLNSGPFPPPELPGLTGTTNPSAIPAGPACPSRASGCGPLPRSDWDFPCCLGTPLRACCRQYPGGTAGPCRSRGGCLTPSEIQRRRPSPEVGRVGSHITAFGACSAFTTRYGLPARGATLWPFASKAPATSLPPPPLRLLPAGTTSCRVGIAPTGDPRLITAHLHHP